MSRAFTSQEKRAIVRLRASRKKIANEDYLDGEKAGISFALKSASFEMLERLTGFKSECGSSYYDTLCGLTFGEILHEICNDQRICKSIQREMEKQHQAGTLNSPDFLSGFLFAATATFSKLAPELIA